MAWDLRGALLAKQEAETARLVDFDFRLRVRTLRLLAPAFALAPDALARRVVDGDDDGLIAALAAEAGMAATDLAAAFARARADARAQLVAERGDPAPHRLA